MAKQAFLRGLPAALLIGALACTALAQQERSASDDPPTLEQRVAALEREVARLDTRLDNRTIGRGQPGAGDVSVLVRRIDQLERSIGMLRSDVARIERSAEAAQRIASDAQRRAAAAENAARSGARF